MSREAEEEVDHYGKIVDGGDFPESTNNIFRGIEALISFSDIGVECLNSYRESVDASFYAGGELLIS